MSKQTHASLVSIDQCGQIVGNGLAVSSAAIHSGHWHAHSFHILMLLDSVNGSVEWEIGPRRSVRSRSVSGDALLWPAGLPGALTFDGDLKCTTIAFAPASLTRWSQELSGFDSVRLSPSSTRDDFMTHLGSALGELSGQTLSEVGAIANSLGKALVAYLLRQEQSLVRLPRREEGLPPSSLQRVKALVESDLEGDLTVAQLARAAGLSPYHFSRKFCISTGQSPHQFVIARRLEHARSLIAAGTGIAAAAIGSGFSSQSHLHHHFRTAFGITPGEFQRQIAAR
ncbi:MAG: helix-turn-helix transcriptional regulator [Leptolyngbya sp. SIO1D8]|nr:helix-turn-helix transcriptional regulator [Leptolyngbya sp. SIO1D8]